MSETSTAVTGCLWHDGALYVNAAADEAEKVAHERTHRA